MEDKGNRGWNSLPPFLYLCKIRKDKKKRKTNAARKTKGCKRGRNKHNKRRG